jgi:hypothetical protein
MINHCRESCMTLHADLFFTLQSRHLRRREGLSTFPTPLYSSSSLALQVEQIG